MKKPAAPASAANSSAPTDAVEPTKELPDLQAAYEAFAAELLARPWSAPIRAELLATARAAGAEGERDVERLEAFELDAPPTTSVLAGEPWVCRAGLRLLPLGDRDPWRHHFTDDDVLALGAIARQLRQALAARWPTLASVAEGVIKGMRPADRPLVRDAVQRAAEAVLRRLVPAGEATLQADATVELRRAAIEALALAKPPHEPALETIAKGDFAVEWRRHEGSLRSFKRSSIEKVLRLGLDEEVPPLDALSPRDTAFYLLLAAHQKSLRKSIYTLVNELQARHDALHAEDDRHDFSSYVRAPSRPPEVGHSTWEIVLLFEETEAVLHIALDGWRCTRLSLTT